MYRNHRESGLGAAGGEIANPVLFCSDRLCKQHMAVMIASLLSNNARDNSGSSPMIAAPVRIMYFMSGLITLYA